MIPAFNAECTLGATLASVQAQTYADLEIIIVDDGSTDATAVIAAAAAERDDRIRLVAQRNAGVAAARNAGIAASRGEWIAPIDADDLWHPDKIALQIEATRAAPRPPGLVYSWSRRIDAHNRATLDLGRPTHRGDVFAQLVASNFLRNASSTLLRRDAVLAVGGFDSSLQEAGAHGAEDIQLYLAIAEREPVEVAPGFLVGYRHLPDSMSQAPGRMRRSIELVLRDVERRRPDLPRRLLQLARMNYDLYAATLALAGGERRSFLRYLARGTARAPVEAGALLGCHAAWRVAASARPRRDLPRFLDLPPDQTMTLFLSDWFNRRQQAAAERAARGRASDRA